MKKLILKLALSSLALSSVVKAADSVRLCVTTYEYTKTAEYECEIEAKGILLINAEPQGEYSYVTPTIGDMCDNVGAIFGGPAVSVSAGYAPDSHVLYRKRWYNEGKSHLCSQPLDWPRL